ncbi:MAG: hypothetical protein H6672_11165 [Anaerolineaceae bacterium]|nr:hypothetical protein [Anaerolineaceae bacterium]
MASNNVLRWRDGRGWFVFSGSTGSDVVRAAALGRASADGGLAYVCMGAADACEQVLEDLEDLGAPSGYLVDVLSEADDAVREKLSEAGIIVISEAGDAGAIRSALMGAAAEGILAAYANGALILLEGAAVAVAGNWIALDNGDVLTGLSWVDSAVFVPGAARVSDFPEVRGVLVDQPEAVAVGIGADSALVLGPDGEIETWGRRHISIVLGSGYNQ